MKNNYKITDETKQEVKELLKKEKRAVVKERLTAINMCINGMTQEDVGKALGRGRGYVGRALKNYFTEGLEGLSEGRGGDRKSELTIEQREELAYIINNSYPINAKGWSGRIIVNLIKEKYGVSYKRKTIYAILKRLNITHKKAKKIDPKKSEEKIKIWKENTKKKLEKLSEDTIVLAQDESRFSSESNSVTSWAEKGKSVNYSGYRYGTSLNCFGSINLGDGYLSTTFHETGNADATIEHFKEVRKAYKAHIPLAFIIDNASWHKTEKVKDFCSRNNITLLFLPPYSPEFNPIERVWSFLKSKFKQRFFSTADAFKKFVFDLTKRVNLYSSTELKKLCSSLI